MESEIYEQNAASKVFSRIGLSLSAILAVAIAVQLIAAGFFKSLLGADHPIWDSSWFTWLMSGLPMYMAAFPVGMLIMHKLPAKAPEEHKLGGMNGLVCFLISVFFMYTGSILGTVLSLLLSGGNATNAVADMVLDNHPLKILFVVILAPLMEEFVFRKQLIDRTRCYGEKVAAFLSALTFGLMHQNLYQFFYAFGLGLLMSYIYLRTGRLRYSTILHAIINFMGSVIAPWIIGLMDLEMIEGLDPNMHFEELMELYTEILPGLMVVMGYAMLLMGLFVAGLVLFIIKCRNLTWKNAAVQLPAGTAFRTVYCNLGMVIYGILCLVMIILNLR